MASDHEPPTWYRLATEAVLESRVPACATMVVVALASIFVLDSQSASSWPTYALAAYVVAGLPRWRGLLFDWGFLLVVALLAYIASTSLWSVPWDARGAVSQVSRALLVLAFVVAVAEGVQVDWFRERLTLALAVVGGVAAALAIAVFSIESPEDGRLNGFGQLDTHVVAAMVYAVAAVCALAWLVSPGDWRPRACRWLVGACLVVLIGAVVLADSRTAIGCLVLGLGSVAVARQAATVSRFILAVGSCAFVLVLLLAASYWLIPGADAMILPRGDSFRPAIWADYAARIHAEALWFGLGVLTPDLIQVEGYDVLHPHSLYLAVTYQGGLVGLGLMLAAMAITTVTLLARYDEPEAKLGLAIWAMALPGYLLDGHELIDKVGWTWLLFWLPVGIALGLRARHWLPDASRFGVRLDDS